MSKIGEIAKKYTESMIALIIALIIIFFVLYQLHSHFSGNIIGQSAGVLGARASGQSYSFSS